MRATRARHGGEDGICPEHRGHLCSMMESQNRRDRTDGNARARRPHSRVGAGEAGGGDGGDGGDPGRPSGLTPREWGPHVAKASNI